MCMPSLKRAPPTNGNGSATIGWSFSAWSSLVHILERPVRSPPSRSSGPFVFRGGTGKISTPCRQQGRSVRDPSPKEELSRFLSLLRLAGDLKSQSHSNHQHFGCTR